ncbi:hypothetical protein CIL05_07810 [Virgibacillus profundi]|uniref:Uncharacterized protein n=1 Tax=Virgibacillus profundi TaxID=2024555 RepID=A0A2A2IG75_9BACI|nr:hypothetical protein [Virgibacillus profundi]PAV30368.1 hypothetical protein CIL05_07810 [Virgibacillus profundi]PXY54540.1 hypothetical protein CIT14_07895 [Virgibacillus profundi]
MDSISFDELNDNQIKEFEKLADDYSYSLQMINLFIENNKLDCDEVWDKANQAYDNDMSYAPNED